MSATSSDLSSTKYGYGVVVATTQRSINATMKAFLDSLQEPVVEVCFVADDAGNPVRISYQQLLERAHGADPFSVPPGASLDSNPELHKLAAARFMAGFRAQLGLPRGYAPAQLPDIVTLPASSGPVTFKLLCSTFQIVELVPGGGYSPPTWLNIQQPDGDAWIFESEVDLDLSTVDGSKFSTLPPDVQKQIKNLSGSAFSVQQLLFDLANAGLSSTIPHIEGVAPGTKLYSLLDDYFLGAYFTQMQQQALPILGASVIPHVAPTSTLTVTNLNFMNNPFMGPNGQPLAHPTTQQQQLATLDYLCAVNGGRLPPASNFTWNWVDPATAGDYDGVVAVNRDAFADYLRNQLQSYVPQNCIKPWVRVTRHDLDTKIEFQMSLTNGQAPQYTDMPGSGPTVLSFGYSDSDSDHTSIGIGAAKFTAMLEIKSSYSLVVEFVDDEIKITQLLVIHVEAEGMFDVKVKGNIVDRKIVDTYTIAVDAQGRLVTRLGSVSSDNPDKLKKSDFYNFFSGGLNHVMKEIEDGTRKFVSTSFMSIPISVVQEFVFPGGKTFTYKSAGFSDSQDLVSYITYVDPS